MPISEWDEMKGLYCLSCGGPATHYYGNTILCCDCHAGEGGGILTREQAELLHRGLSPFPQPKYEVTLDDFGEFYPF